MTITLELPPELESELAAEAERLHLPLEAYVLRVLESVRVTAPLGGSTNTVQKLPNVFAEARAKLGDHPPRTGAELVAYWEREGVIGSRPDITDSQEYARMLREQAQHRTHG